MSGMDLISSSKVTMSSREIAELAGKAHLHVLRDIREMCPNLDRYSKSTTYVDNLGRKYPEWLLSKRDTLLLVSGYSVKLRARIIDRLQELEEANKFNIPQTYVEALQVALEQAKQLELKDKQLEAAAPKVAFVDSYVDAEGLLAFRQVSKLLEVPEATLRSFLTKKRYTYKLNGCWMFNKYFVDQGYGCIKTFTTEWGNAKTSIKFTPKGVEMLSRNINKGVV